MDLIGNWGTCQSVASAIADTVKGKNVLLIASSDLSHFHSYDQAVGLDKIVLSHIDRFDPEGLNRDLKNGRCEACGGGPIISIMLAAEILGPTRGGFSNISILEMSLEIGAGSLGMQPVYFIRQRKGRSRIREEKKVGIDLGLVEEEKKVLHHIAKTVIENKARGKAVPEFKIEFPS